MRHPRRCLRSSIPVAFVNTLFRRYRVLPIDEESEHTEDVE